MLPAVSPVVRHSADTAGRAKAFYHILGKTGITVPLYRDNFDSLYDDTHFLALVYVYKIKVQSQFRSKN